MGLADYFLSKKDREAMEESLPKPAEKPKYTILFVDDEPGVLKAMSRIFRHENYNILLSGSPLEALEILKEKKVHVVVSDYRMPKMNGADFLIQVKPLYPETIRIMLTGHADVNAVMGAINQGAVYKFITKPWNDDDLRLTVSLALEQYDMIRENKSLKQTQIQQSRNIDKLKKYLDINRSQLGIILLKRKIISEPDLEKAKEIQSRSGQVLSAVLIEMGLIKENLILEVIQTELKIKRVFPAEFQVSAALASMVSKEICLKNILVPLKMQQKKLMVAMADPTDFMKIDDIRFLTGIHLEPVVASQKEIIEKITEIYGESDSLEDLTVDFDISDPTETIEVIFDQEDETLDIQDLLTSKDLPPAIRIVNCIISDALRHNASDIHIEPKTKNIMVRYRIDGLLQEKIHIPLSMHALIVSRIKIMSELDISERRRPQGGRITIKTPTKIVDVRIATLPTINGEKIVLRILDRNSPIKDLSELGLMESQVPLLTKLIRKPQGCILATGPTGSGKTSTLYSIINQSATIDKNFTTIEDPVEYYMSMAEQVMVREKIGLTFPVILRTILRQDPDVIMLGEIRDFETAEVAFHAALTGHVVLTTLHTNSSLATISRLTDMGIKSYVLCFAINGIIAQRLVRKTCPDCLADDPSAPEIISLLTMDEDYQNLNPRKGKGCPRCNHSGYMGRIGIFEIFIMTDEIKYLIMNNASEAELESSARAGGMISLYDAGMEKVRQGLTTCEEILRVLGPQNVNALNCAGCGSKLKKRYHYCPYCGSIQSLKCGKCGGYIRENWNACPKCGKKIKKTDPTGNEDDRHDENHSLCLRSGSF